jgi:hypothetical protein
VPLSTVRNQLEVFERTLRRVLAFEKANTLNYIKFRNPISGRGRKINMSARIQEVIIQERGYPDTSTVWPLYSTYQRTIDTFDTVYRSFNETSSLKIK